MDQEQTVHEWLERFYHFVLMHTKEGIKHKSYLAERGITEETIKEFKIGFAPNDIKATLEFLKGKKYSFNDLVEAKILNRYKSGDLKGKLTDPFKNRIIFPIQNHRGETVAFGGRTIDENSKVKYINSAESTTFIKGDNLYGFKHAKKGIKEKDFVVLFEGYFDTITAFQNDITNSVSTLGTTLTHNQSILIKNITKNVVIAFDGDTAGRQASYKSASALESVGCNVRIAHIDKQLDPDDYIKEYGGIDFQNNIVAKAKPVIDSFLEFKATEYDLTTAQDRFAYANDVLNNLSMNDGQEIKKVLNKVGTRLNVPLKVMYEKVIS